MRSEEEMKNLISIYLILALIFTLITVSQAASPIAVVLKSRGKVDLLRTDEAKPSTPRKGTVLYDGDKIKTGEASFCAIRFTDDNSLLRIKENSSCAIEGKKEQEKTNKNIIVEVGSFFTKLFRPRGSFSVTTPTSVASVKGTEWWTIQMADGRTIFIVTEDMINLQNQAGSFLGREGQTIVFTSNREAPEITLTNPNDIPTWDEEAGRFQMLEIEFQDAEGRTRDLRIDYLEQ
jgi:hypothetical protein